MKLLGKLTGTIYPDGYDKSKIQECCTCIPDDKANDKRFIELHHQSDLLVCINCLGCPAAKQNCV